MTNDLIVHASFNDTVTLLDLSHLAVGITLEPNSARRRLDYEPRPVPRLLLFPVFNCPSHRH